MVSIWIVSLEHDVFCVKNDVPFAMWLKDQNPVNQLKETFSGKGGRCERVRGEGSLS